jgi:hypothetical protein
LQQHCIMSNIVFFQMMQILNPYIPQWPRYCLRCTSVKACDREAVRPCLTVVRHLGHWVRDLPVKSRTAAAILNATPTSVVSVTHPRSES